MSESSSPLLEHGGRCGVGDTIEVLHIDDDPDFASLTAEFLEREDDRIAVETATSASDGLARLDQKEFDAIISDYDMPDCNGIELLKEVREDDPTVPFILFTGRGSENVASEAISTGVTDYLQKSSGTEVYKLLANRVENAVTQYRAQQQAAESERRVRELTESTNDILWEFTADWNELLVINSAYEEIWGRETDALAENPRDFLHGVHPDDRELVENAMAALSDGQSADIEFRVNSEEEYRRWVWVQGEPIFGEDGEPVRVAGFVRDITERRERERELETTKTRLARHNRGLRDLYEISADREMDLDAKIKAVLELGRDHLGTEAAFLSSIDRETDRFEVMYSSGDDDRLVPGSVTPLSESYCRKTIVKDEVCEVEDAQKEGWLDDPAYGRWDYESYIGGVVQVGGELYGTLCFVDRGGVEDGFSDADRTFVNLASQWVGYELERQRRADRLEEYKEYTGRILDGIEDLFFVHGPEMNLQRWNDSFTEVTGYSDAEVAAMDGLELIPETDRQRTADAIRTVFETGHARLEVPLLRKDGTTVPYEFTANRIEHPDGGQRLVGIGRDITTRRERERDLRETKQRLELALEGTNTGVWEWNLETETVVWNEAQERMVGLEPGTFEGTADALRQRVHPEDWPRIQAALDDALEGDAVIQLEYRLHAGKESNWIWIDARCRLVRDGSGDRRVVWVNNDITTRKERERQLEGIIENTDSAIYIKDTDGIYQFMNESGAAVFDMDREAIVGKSDAELFDENSFDQIIAGDRAAIERGESISRETVFTIDGEERVFLDNKYPYRAEDGEILGVMGISRDITDRKKRERELAETRERMEVALEATDAAIWDLDLQSDELNYYPDTNAYLATEPESQDELLEMVHPADRQRIEEALETAKETGEYEAEFRITGDDEPHWIKGEGRIEFDETGTPVRGLGVGRDVTERKRREQELHRTNERLEKFTSVVSHDLQNPLSVAEGRLELARHECDSDHLDSVADALARMRTLIDELLLIAQKGNRESDTAVVDLAETVDVCWQNVDTTGATLSNEADCRIRADRSSLQQLLENLIDNAAEHGSTSSRTQSDDAVEHGGEGVTITVGTLADGFYVEDDGPGIPEAERPNVFQSGYSNAEAGTGFGLWIVAEIADAHDWEITVTEGHDGGARFEVTGVDVVE